MKSLFYLNKYFVKYKKRLLIGVVFVCFANVFKVLSPKVLGYAVDLVSSNLEKISNVNNSDFSIQKNILYAIGIYFLLALMGAIFTFLMRQSIIVMSRLIENDLRNEIYAHYQTLDQSFYKRNNTGDLMNRATEDVSKVRMYLGPAIMYSINVLMLFSFVIYAMLRIDVGFTLWVLLPMPILIFSIYKVQSLINIRSRKIQEKLSDLTTYAQEFYSGIRVLKSFVQEDFAVQFYKEKSENYKVEALKMARIEAFFFPLMILLIGISTVIVVYLGGIKMNNGSITAGNILEFVFYVNMLTWPISSVGWVATLVQTAAASQSRINAFLNTQSKIKNKGKISKTLQGDIVFDQVNFCYEDTGIEAIKDLSFHIKAGEKWAIMGKTGSGKTTLVELVMRLYDTTSGNINIDNEKITEFELAKYRAQIGYVPQDVFLFSDSIAHNIKFSAHHFSDKAIEKAAEKAAVATEINKFPQKYQTIVGERGVTLSGGQKQRIAIARALIKEPQIYIFDDALSALDTKTEQKILENIAQNIQDKTLLLVTHRIPAHIQFDKILVLENGKLLEIGTHNELINNNSYYAGVYQKQQK